MAEPLPISGLPAAVVPFEGDELLPVVQAGVTCQAPASAFGVPVAELTLANHGVDVPETSLYVVPADGLYLLVASLACVVAKVGAGNQVLEWFYTDFLGDQAIEEFSLGLTALEQDESVRVAYCKNGHHIAFSCENTGVYNNAQFSLSLCVVRLS